MLREGGRSDDHLGMPVTASPPHLGGDLQLGSEDSSLRVQGIHDETSPFSATTGGMDLESWSQLFSERVDSYNPDI